MEMALLDLTDHLRILVCGSHPEAYTPTILLRSARRLGKEIRDESYVTEQEVERRPLGETLPLGYSLVNSSSS